MKNNTIYILDSYGLIYRSYYAFISRPLVNEKGENVSAIYGFFSNFLSLLQKNEVNYLAPTSFPKRLQNTKQPDKKLPKIYMHKFQLSKKYLLL